MFGLWRRFQNDKKIENMKLDSESICDTLSTHTVIKWLPSDSRLACANIPGFFDGKCYGI